MTKPTSYLNWGGPKVEPAEVQKTAGFATGDRPPAQWFNWLFGTMDLWLKWFESAEFRSLIQRNIEINALLTGGYPINLGATGAVFYCGAVNSNGAVVVGGTAPNNLWTSESAGNYWMQGSPANSFNGTFYAAAARGALLLVGGTNGALQTSPDDGANWTARTSTFDASTIYDMAVGTTRTVAVGQAGKSAHSADGITWTANTALPNDSGGQPTDLKVVATDGAQFFAARGPSFFLKAAAGDPSLWRSSDGSNFVAVDLSALLAPGDAQRHGMEWVQDVAYSPTLGWVALVTNTYRGGEGHAPYFSGLLISSDGNTWTRKHTAPPINVDGVLQQFYSLFTPGAGILLIGSGIAAYSADGAAVNFVYHPALGEPICCLSMTPLQRTIYQSGNDGLLSFSWSY